MKYSKTPKELQILQKIALEIGKELKKEIPSVKVINNSLSYFKHMIEPGPKIASKSRTGKRFHNCGSNTVKIKLLITPTKRTSIIDRNVISITIEAGIGNTRLYMHTRSAYWISLSEITTTDSSYDLNDPTSINQIKTDIFNIVKVTEQHSNGTVCT